MDGNNKNRLVELRKALNSMKQGEFAQKLGIKQSTWANIETGINPLADRYIRLICLTFGVSEQWLRTGEGNMFTTEDPDTTEFLKIYRALPSSFRKLFLEYGRFLIEQQNSISQPTNP
jgi:transcriptional regulator with XRE-family HTH domain